MSSKTVDVIVSQGILRGSIEKNEYGGHYIAFRGIPYAKPPVGKLRFKDPVPAESWYGIRDALKFGSISIQIDILTQEIIGSEDCLYLNVYTNDIKPREKRPVMVWIHGGRYTYGSGDEAHYGPDHLVQKDVVLVTLNYRLGVFGFLNLQHEMAAGNQALKDITMVLEWIHRNISNFGGDPGNVTIFGESAGGALVHFVAISPLANGLFHKVITQSGVATADWALALWQKSFLLAEKLGKRTMDPKIAGEFLKRIDAKEIIKVSRNILTNNEYRQNVMGFGPTADFNLPKPFFPEDPEVMLRRGISKEIPFLFGFNSNEGSFFINTLTDKTLEIMDSNFWLCAHPKLFSKIKKQSIRIDDVRFTYFGNKAISKETIANYADMLSDTCFIIPIHEAADIQMQMGHRSSYMYNLAYESETSLIRLTMNIDLPGVAHGEDLFYLFHPHAIKDLGLEMMKQNSDDYRMIKCMTQIWTDFAKTGNPTPAITELTPIKWTPLETTGVYNYLNIDKELRMKTVHKGERRFDWKSSKHKL